MLDEYLINIQSTSEIQALKRVYLNIGIKFSSLNPPSTRFLWVLSQYSNG
jgi:hypothetical protein